MSEIIIRLEPLGGSPLARAALAGSVPSPWYRRRPSSGAEWREYVESVRAEFAASDWLARLAPAIDASGDAHRRLERVSRGAGVLVTTGQQPGLFGGPIMTWTKALTALAVADEIERVTGVPAAPLFWAATDDADFAEGAWTVITTPDGAERIAIAPAQPPGAPMSAMPLGDVSAQFEALARAARSAPDDGVLRETRRAYQDGATVGDAYVRLLRTALAPLGIPVLDASHPAVRLEAQPVLRRALERADAVAERIAARDAEIHAEGFEPQVGEVAGLSLVFHVTDAEKARIPIAEAATRAATASGELSPNVLLRPVVERAILPTVAYMAGPGEFAYFAQVSAVAEALERALPLAMPRCSLTLVEPQVSTALRELELDIDDLRDPHAAENRIARRTLPAATGTALGDAGRSLGETLAALRAAVVRDGPTLPVEAIDGVERAIAHRLERLERRVLAAVKREQELTLRKVRMARGALFPLGVRQERALNMVSLLARHGAGLLGDMVERIREHASALVAGEAVPVSDPTRAADASTTLETGDAVV